MIQPISDGILQGAQPGSSYSLFNDNNQGRQASFKMAVNEESDAETVQKGKFPLIELGLISKFAEQYDLV